MKSYRGTNEHLVRHSIGFLGDGRFPCDPVAFRFSQTRDTNGPIIDANKRARRPRYLESKEASLRTGKDSAENLTVSLLNVTFLQALSPVFHELPYLTRNKWLFLLFCLSCSFVAAYARLRELQVSTAASTTAAPTTVATTAAPTTVVTTAAPTTVVTTAAPTTAVTTAAPTTVVTTAAPTTVVTTAAPTTAVTTAAPTTAVTTAAVTTVDLATICDIYCQGLNGPASYCKFEQNPPTCLGGDEPCGSLAICGAPITVEPTQVVPTGDGTYEPACDTMCQSLNDEASYCKWWLPKPTCLGGDQPCGDQSLCTSQTWPPAPAPTLPSGAHPHESAPCNAYCVGLNGPTSYCKWWKAEPVCYGGDQPCSSTDCDSGTAAPTQGPPDSHDGPSPNCDDYCTSVNPALGGDRVSYCKWWLHVPVCFDGDQPCGPSVCNTFGETTTQAATTVAPTTQAATTVAPTTQAATTVAPTTPAATTFSP